MKKEEAKKLAATKKPNADTTKPTALKTKAIPKSKDETKPDDFDEGKDNYKKMLTC